MRGQKGQYDIDEVAEGVIEAGLQQYNQIRTMPATSDSRALAVLVSDATSKKVIGGLPGRTFQAPDFYERLGYRILGQIECRSRGHTRLCHDQDISRAVIG